MLLAIDIGNTNIVLGLYRGKKLITHWRLATQSERTSDEYGVLIGQLIAVEEFRCEQISAIVASCVVRPCSRRPGWRESFQTRSAESRPGSRPECRSFRKLRIRRRPHRHGVAAYEKIQTSYRGFRTATTIDLISKKGEYIGGAIAPGLSIALEALVQRAAKLPRIEVIKPKEVIGKNTVSSIQAGIFFGYAGLVDGIVRRMQIEHGVPSKVVATGGLVVDARRVRDP